MPSTVNDKRIKKARTKQSALVISGSVRLIDLSSLISSIFMQTNDPVARELIHKYEAQLVFAHEEPEKFQKGLHVFFSDTARYIKKNNLYKEFYSFCYFVFTVLSDRQKTRAGGDTEYNTVLDCYYDLLLQQMSYFAPHPYIVCGYRSDGKLMTRTEPFPYLDIAIMELLERASNPTQEMVYQNFKRRGLDISSESELSFYQFNDQLLTNMTYVMSCLINDNTPEIVPDKLFMVANGMNLLQRNDLTDRYREILRERRYFLPMKGTKGVYQNCGEVAEVFYQEIFTDSRVVLLYKITATDGGEFAGFYDSRFELFYSPWDNSVNGTEFHLNLENFILESYCYLTTDMDESIKDLGLIRRVFPVDKVPAIALKPVPSVQFFYETGSSSKKGSKSGSYEPFNKEDYQEWIKSFGPQTRKLPEGWKASEEAKELAKQYRYVLREGETFVRPFEKRVYRKEQ